MLTRTTLKEQAYNQIKQLLITQELHPGAPISEPALVAKLGVSRTPVREALLTLASEGFLDGSSYAGMRVHTLTNSERQEVIQVRRALEKMAIRQLGTQVTQEHLEALRTTLKRQTELIPVQGPITFLEADAAFHLSIAQFAGMTIVQKLLRNLRELFYLVGAPAVAGVEQRESIVREHRLILDAIASGDVYEALSALDNHLDQTLLRTQLASAAKEAEAAGSSK